MNEHTLNITARGVFDILNPVASAVENLACHQEQCDMVMVKVSRQALDEVLEAVNKLAIAAAQDTLLAEPTEAMLNAARDWSVAKFGRGIGNDAAKGCWQAMLAASTVTSTVPHDVEKTKGGAS